MHDLDYDPHACAPHDHLPAGLRVSDDDFYELVRFDLSGIDRLFCPNCPTFPHTRMAPCVVISDEEIFEKVLRCPGITTTQVGELIGRTHLGHRDAHRRLADLRAAGRLSSESARGRATTWYVPDA